MKAWDDHRELFLILIGIASMRLIEALALIGYLGFYGFYPDAGLMLSGSFGYGVYFVWVFSPGTFGRQARFIKP